MNLSSHNHSQILSGPFRSPVNMLVHQEYDGHNSLHDGDVAADLGL